MDSLTQMVLGAACGEAVAGKKLGNRALIWGAFAGTIPDMDVLGNLFLNPLDSLAFHRGPMHSLLFAVVFPFILAVVVYFFYKKGIHHKLGWRWFTFIFSILLILFILIAILGLTYLSAGYWVILAAGILFPIAYLIVRKIYFGHVRNVIPLAENNYWTWVVLFFISIATHPILDSFTTFGTQLFWPFYDLRVSCSNISIVDPFYTIPFLLCVIACGFLDRSDVLRARINMLGLGLSSIYMLFTIQNKGHVEQVFKDSFAKEGIHFSQHLVTPTILNNLLWYGIAKGDSAYYCSYYSVWDKEAKLKNIEVVPFNNLVSAQYMSSPNFSRLRWFSDDYFNLYPTDSDTLLYADLRFGSMNFSFKKPEDFIFKFYLKNSGDDVEMLPGEERTTQTKEQINKFWRRVKGY